MSSNGLGGLLGAALSLYVIHEVLKDGRTGRRLGYVRARSIHHAKQLISKRKDLPNHVRVFYGKDIPGRKKKVTKHVKKSGFGFSANVTMPRLF